MSQRHSYYLGLGSNIEPAHNLAKAIERLGAAGEIESMSSVWESRAVGSGGPNFLNLCVSYRSPLGELDLKGKVLLPIEMALGRVRQADKNAPRTIDIDILMQDGVPLNTDRWGQAFVIMPMAELLPTLQHPTDGKPMSEAAQRCGEATWIIRRPEVLMPRPGPTSS